jgi:hypothetical protein
VKKGILNSLSKTVDEVRFSSHKVSFLSFFCVVGWLFL